MRLVINFDFFNEIRNVNEPLGISKVIRNEKRLCVINIPLYFGFDYLVYAGQMNKILPVIGAQCMIALGAELTLQKVRGDEYSTNGKKRLLTLARNLNVLNVDTTYDMLLQSELYEERYKISFNENKIPFLMQEKYVLVPTNGFNGKVTDTSILQEHEIGSREYILSLGKPSKSKKLVKSLA